MGNNLIFLAGVAVIVGAVIGAMIGGAYYARVMREMLAGIVEAFMRHGERMDSTLTDPEAGSTLDSRTVTRMARKHRDARK